LAAKNLIFVSQKSTFLSISRALTASLAILVATTAPGLAAEQRTYAASSAPSAERVDENAKLVQPAGSLSTLGAIETPLVDSPRAVEPVEHREACGFGGSGCSSCERGGCCSNCCAPPKSLFQWSYGAEPEGGPAPMDEPLISDRPDFTEASTTVGRGVVQLEAGYTYTFDRNGDDFEKEHSFPETLLRVGALAEWFELRIAYNHGSLGVHELGDFDSGSGGRDLYLGTKIGLTLQQGILPEMALVPQMTVPTGSETFTAHHVCPGLNWLYGWDINDFLSCGGSTQGNKSVDVDGSSFTLMAQSFTIGYSLTERIGAYTEYFGLYPSGATSALPENYFDGGFTFSVTNNLQLDIRAGLGLNAAAADYFLGSGFVVRF
jgi:Putative MetA-pathway of phenol degradation